jgi:uncharacterized protein with GYD domain
LKGGDTVFTYAGLITLTPEGREALDKAPDYLEKFKHLIEEEGGVLEDTFALMGPWDFLALVKYPDNAAAFRALAKIGRLEVIKTETFPIEKVDVFVKALVYSADRRAVRGGPPAFFSRERAACT